MQTLAVSCLESKWVSKEAFWRLPFVFGHFGGDWGVVDAVPKTHKHGDVRGGKIEHRMGTKTFLL